MASRQGHDKCVSLLLQHGAGPNIADKSNITPLYIACQKSHDICVSVLLQHGANRNIADKSNNTIIHSMSERS